MKNKNYKVVIPSAGIGSRVGPYTKFLNKSLITVGNKPVISHIIDKFDPSIEIIILLGYKGDHIRQVVTAIYPDRKFNFVIVDRFEGEGSGLGYSLQCAKNELQSPFIFISNDTLISDKNIDLDPNIFGNWLGYVNRLDYEKSNNNFNISEYRTIEKEDAIVTKINPKGIKTDNIYIGLCGVLDYKKFWKTMDDGLSIDAGESFGLKSLNDIKAISFETSWMDIGNLELLEQTKNKFLDPEYNILEKENEAIWFIKDRVIKFSTDESFIAGRCKRIQNFEENKNLFPTITHQDKNLYVYTKEDGKVLSDILTIPRFKKLFRTMNNIWDKKVDPITWSKNIEFFEDILINFYKIKTYQRIEDFFSRFEFVDDSNIINGILIPPVEKLLEQVDWDFLCRHKISFGHYHGDFHNENILFNDKDELKLLDWRQNFGRSDNLEFGDIYYDFAKFYHGLLVPHYSIKHSLFKIESHSNDEIFIDIFIPYRFVEIEEEFLNWIEKNGYSIKKTKILTALIYLNIAGLHEYPYSLFLFYLGKYLLNKWLWANT